MDSLDNPNLPGTLDHLRALLATIEPSRDLDAILRRALGVERKPTRREMSAGRFYTCDEIADETHFGATKVRAWFAKNRGGCLVDGHDEKLHKRKHVSIRISPAARASFLKAHGLR